MNKYIEKIKLTDKQTGQQIHRNNMYYQQKSRQKEGEGSTVSSETRESD